MSLEPDHGHAHAHKTGLPWLDVVLAVSVVSISVMSLIVSIYHGRVMEKLVHENEQMVAAQTLPYLMVYESDFDLKTGRRQASFELKNGGVGPALIDWMELRWRGRAYERPIDLIRACCAAAAGSKASGIAFGNVSGSILPAKETRELIVNLSGDPAVDVAVDRAIPDLSVRACYCSVLEQCWETDFAPGRPKPVKDCHVPPGLKRW